MKGLVGRLKKYSLTPRLSKVGIWGKYFVTVKFCKILSAILYSKSSFDFLINPYLLDIPIQLLLFFFGFNFALVKILELNPP